MTAGVFPFPASHSTPAIRFANKGVHLFLPQVSPKHGDFYKFFGAQRGRRRECLRALLRKDSAPALPRYIFCFLTGGGQIVGLTLRDRERKKESERMMLSKLDRESPKEVKLK